VERQEEGSGIFRDPRFAIRARAEEVDVVAEALDDVLLEVPGNRLEERDHRRCWLGELDAVGRDREAHAITAGFTGRFDSRGLFEKLRQKERIPSAPGVKPHSVDLEAVL